MKVTMPMRRIAITLLARVPSQVIEQHSVASPYVIGEELAHQVALYEQQHHLGYFPPVDYFRSDQRLESELLEALDSICWLVKGMVREEVKLKLRSLFEKVEIESAQAVANTMPTVRPGASNATRDLALHFTPDQIRINLIVTRKVPALGQVADEQTELAVLQGSVHKCLVQRFTRLEIPAIYYFDGDND